MFGSLYRSSKSIQELTAERSFHVHTECAFSLWLVLGDMKLSSNFKLDSGPQKASRSYGETHLARVCEHCEWLKLRDGLGNCGVLGLGGFRILPPQIPIVRPPHPAPRMLLEFTWNLWSKLRDVRSRIMTMAHPIPGSALFSQSKLGWSTPQGGLGVQESHLISSS